MVRFACRFLVTVLVLHGFPDRAEAAAPVAPAGIALVELFTSEGCSSCPAADELLATMAADAKASGTPVYCLSFHVDYWNKLGWADPFSDPAYTKRQQAYVKLLHVRCCYTPQMVINGTVQFVGSDRVAADNAVKRVLSRKPAVTVPLRVVARDKTLAIECKPRGAPGRPLLCVAWTEAAAVSTPDGGENKGRILKHVNVVRGFRSVVLTSSFDGKVSLVRPAAVAGTVFAFVQDPWTGRVLGAAAVPVAAGH